MSMIEKCARAIAKAADYRDGDMIGDYPAWWFFKGHASAAIEALIEEPASGTMLARVEEVARSLNRFRSEDHIKSVALDSLSIHREILRSYLRTALSQPNEEGEGK